MENNDLISRSELLKKIGTNTYYSIDPYNQRGKIFEMVALFPAVDVEPVRHGRWIPTNDDNKKRCSRCDIIHLIAQYPHGQANYCPNCGAKMDAEVEG